MGSTGCQGYRFARCEAGSLAGHRSSYSAPTRCSWSPKSWPDPSSSSQSQIGQLQRPHSSWAAIALVAVAALVTVAITWVTIASIVEEGQIKRHFQRDQPKQQLAIAELQVQVTVAKRVLNQTDPKRLALAIVRVPELVIIK